MTQRFCQTSRTKTTNKLVVSVSCVFWCEPTATVKYCFSNDNKQFGVISSSCVLLTVVTSLYNWLSDVISACKAAVAILAVFVYEIVNMRWPVDVWWCSNELVLFLDNVFFCVALDSESDCILESIRLEEEYMILHLAESAG